MFTPIPMTLPPGVVRNGTRYAQKGRWYATNMVRFVNDAPERWGGWEKISEESLGLAARGAPTAVPEAESQSARAEAVGSRRQLPDGRWASKAADGRWYPISGGE